MSVIPITFLGTPDFASYHLQSLINDEHYQIVGVISQPDRPAGRKMKVQPSPVKKMALENNLRVITPEKIDRVTVEEVKSWKAEAAVVVAYGQILPQIFLDLYPRRIVNVHGSLLPKWRGAAPIQRSIMAGDKETGVSLQVMVKKLDAGDVLGIRNIELGNEIDAIELHDRMKVLGAELLHIEFMDYLRGNLTPQPQNESEVTYAHKLEKPEGLITWEKSANEICNLIRGMKLGPGTFCYLNNVKYKFHRAVPTSSGSGKPGSITEIDSDSFTVACGEGALKLFEIQPESRAKISVEEFFRGNNLKIGDQFVSNQK